jgi:ribosomal protein RSM22 (predicted rRNA methylase)
VIATDGADEALRVAIDRVLAGTSRRELAGSSQELSGRYRDPRAGERPVRRSADAEAYVAARLPATFTALGQVFAAAAALQPDFRPESQVDLGAGTGAAAWAAAARWPGIGRVRLVDRATEMIGLGRRLREADPRGPDAEWAWQRADLVEARPDPADLVTVSYVLGEVDPVRRVATARAAWAATRGMLAMVEPGTPAGFAVIREVRRALCDDGAALLAPCPHDRACPMTGSDWCHFAARVQRSALHRQVKGADLSYEDEKFSYVVFTRSPAGRAAARVLRHPRRPPRRIEFAACTRDGLRTVQVTRSQPAYRTAKKLGWGSALPPDVLG